MFVYAYICVYVCRTLKSHEHVLGFLGCYHEQDTQAVYILTEYCEHGSLQKLLRSFRFDVEQQVDFARQIASGMAHIHATDIVHRDLRADNVLIFRDEQGVVRCKVADFGLYVFIVIIILPLPIERKGKN